MNNITPEKKRVSDEKLTSAIAWFEADERPNATDVNRGELASLLRELQDVRDAEYKRYRRSQTDAFDGGRLG